jgi:alpha-glucosidase
MNADWWRQAVVYQIYPRSFADANGDGVGDLPGITSRVSYLAGLGVDAVWLSPFYPSALADGGYDVDDHRAVDPRIGTLAQFDDMVAALHGAGLRVIVDIVPNHTSNRHAWFAEALRSPPGSYARDRYIFRRGQGVHGERSPTDWTAGFGGSAWEPVRDGEYYLHLFAPEQPDLNWANQDVRDDFRATLRFWADRGVDGFRVDAANFLAKDLAEPLPSQAELAAGLADGRHPYRDRDEVHDIYRSWREVFNEYTPPRMAVAEAWEPAHRQARYASIDGLGQAFNLELLVAPWQAAEMRAAIGANLSLAAASGDPPTWVLSNHDVVRHASRFALPPGTDLARWLVSGGQTPPPDDAAGLRRARAAILMMLALPGSSYLYQGEELGLPEVADLPPEAIQDPLFVRSGGAVKGRDGCRVPLPWTAGGSSFGFGPDGAHLPQPPWLGRYAAETQAGLADSTRTLYAQALAHRRRLQSAEELRWAGSGPDDVIHFSRPGGWTSVTNFGRSSVPLPAGELLLASGSLDDSVAPPALPADTTAWLLAAPA